MGTVKRERQKANRQIRLEELHKTQLKVKRKRNLLRYGVGLLVVIGLVILWAQLTKSKGKDNVATTTTTLSTGPTTTSGPTTQPTQAVAEGKSITGSTPCPKADGSEPRAVLFEKEPPTCIDPSKTYTAKVETNKGTFTVALDVKKAPKTVNNFVVLARYHYFDNVSCHRIIKGFAIQCGDPTGTGSGKNPGYTIPDELPAAATEYKAGMLAMANVGRANSGGSQFFITLDNSAASLTPTYSLFGSVSEGFNTTVRTMEAAADPSASGGVPTKEPITMTMVTITES